MIKRLLIIVNDPTFFLSHRLPIAIGAKEAGYDVCIATGVGEAVNTISQSGFSHYCLPLSRSGKNPFTEIKTLFALYRLIRKLNPSLVHLVTIKPVVYGGIVARLAGVPSVVSAISGLGTVFVSEDLRSQCLRKLVQLLYKSALFHSNIKVIFQNTDDQSLLQSLKVVAKTNTTLVRGSGVNLAEYPFRVAPPGVVTVSFVGRLLREKGIVEFVEAARIIKSHGIEACFQVIGDLDAGNPSSVSKEDFVCWRKEGVVSMLGYRQDIPTLLSQSHIVVLPSYREGLPKVLVEAAAAGRPVVTTDVPGCRDAIEPNKTGLLVPTKDPVALAEAIKRLIENPDLRHKMGLAGRLLAEKEYAIEKIVAAHLRVYAELEASAR